MPDNSALESKWKILMAEQERYLATHRDIAFKVLNLLLESFSSDDLHKQLERLRQIERERNEAQTDIESARTEGTAGAVERMLDRAISSMERMNDGAKEIVSQLDQLLKTRDTHIQSG